MTREYSVLIVVAISSGFSLAGARAGENPVGTLNQAVTTGGSVAPIPAKGAPTDWRKETEASCGMACRYHRANDNLTMQALYLVTKIGKIDATLRKDPDSDQARVSLGAFCKDQAEELSVCFARYKDFQRVALLELRQAIGKNEDTIARLTNGRKADGTVDGTALVFETGEEKLPYMPEVPTLAELEQSYLDGKLKPHGATYSRAEIQKWSESLVLPDPKGKFLQFESKPVVGNPYQTEKSSYSLHREKRDASGKASEDKRVVDLYERSEKAIKNFAKDKSIEDGKIKVITPTKNLKKEDGISYEALVQARSVVNSKMETDVNRSDQEEKDRKIASDKDPKPKPSPSGSPSATDPNAGVAREVSVTTNGSAGRTPSGMKIYDPNEKVERRVEMKNSRYIKYDIGDILTDTENSTK